MNTKYGEECKHNYELIILHRHLDQWYHGVFPMRTNESKQGVNCFLESSYHMHGGVGIPTRTRDLVAVNMLNIVD